MRSIDWSASPLGPPAAWPHSLRIATRLILNARHPLFIFWGPESICLFNDAYAPMIGAERREGAMGRPGKEVWSEIWDVISPEIEQVKVGRCSSVRSPLRSGIPSAKCGRHVSVLARHERRAARYGYAGAHETIHDGRPDFPHPAAIGGKRIALAFAGSP
ncbi:MAG: hypothetical protein ABI277_17155, partial [Burkholderiaceae bacterium]